MNKTIFFPSQASQDADNQLQRSFEQQRNQQLSQTADTPERKKEIIEQIHNLIANHPQKEYFLIPLNKNPNMSVEQLEKYLAEIELKMDLI